MRIGKRDSMEEKAKQEAFEQARADKKTKTDILEEAKEKVTGAIDEAAWKAKQEKGTWPEKPEPGATEAAQPDERITGTPQDSEAA